jgi:isoquinoline 1-oxidoreductase alpha subunit
MATFTLNGKSVSIDVEPETPLLWVLREQLGLTGTKYGCGIGACGACTVLFEGQAMRSCSLPVVAAEGRKIETIESLQKNGQLSQLQKAWIDHQVPQCGYCQSGMIMAATALLRNNSKPTDDEINASISNICRCGTFQEVRAAIRSVIGVRKS